MIDLYTWGTPNGHKISIMLEECGLDYKAHPINIGNEEQFAPEFLKISPNNKIPAIVDNDVEGAPVSVFESGAILIYLAEKTGKFLSSDPTKKAKTLQWLMWQIGGYGPMTGQFYHFQNLEGKPDYSAYAFSRFSKEVKRLHNVLNKQLEGQDYIAGEYSIADISLYSWVKVGFSRVETDNDRDLSNITAWLDRVGQRAAVGRGMTVPAV